MAAARLEKLEAIRGFSAVYIVIYHLSHLYMRRGFAQIPLLFGPEAVTIFFVLSGFVIYYSAHLNPLDLVPRNYAIKRIRRIYPIFLCALLMSYLSHVLTEGKWVVPQLKMVLGNLFMMQDFAGKPGVWIGTFYNNGPLWSLAYEWWFYVLFFILIHLVRVPGRRQYYAAGVSLFGIVSYLLFPNQISLYLMYFMIWWCGTELAREYIDNGRITWQRQMAPLGMLAALSVLWSLPVIGVVMHHQHLIMNACPMLLFRHILAGVVLIPVGIVWHKMRFIGFRQLFGSFAVFAPMSYAIYVVHFPILSALEQFHPGRHGLLKSAIVCVSTVLLAYLLEEQMQPLVNRWSKRFLIGPRLSVPAPALQSSQNQNIALGSAPIAR